MDELPVAALRRLVAALDSLNIAFAVIGGVAVSIRAVPRYTADVDAVIWTSHSDLQDLVVKLRGFGFATRAQDPIGFARRNRLILLEDPEGVHVDLSIGGLPFEENTIRNADRIQVENDLSIPVAGVESLIVMKAIASRPKDLEDIRNLLATNAPVDQSKVLTTVSEFAELLETPELTSQLEALFKELDRRR